VRAGAHLKKEAAAESSGTEVLGLEVERLEQALQEAHVRLSLGIRDGHEREEAPSEVAVQMEDKRAIDFELKQLRSENDALKERLAAANRRSSPSNQGQASMCLITVDMTSFVVYD
jgi:hypothetical protein